MPIRLKSGVNPEALRKYGFKLGREYFGKERWCGDGVGYEYQADWMHKFLMDPDDSEKVLYTDDEFDIPMVQLSFRFGKGFAGDLYADCAPSCTYHIGGGDLDVLTDTVFSMCQDGIIKMYKSE